MFDRGGNFCTTYPEEVDLMCSDGTKGYRGNGTDVWALGCIFVMLTTGKPPFSHKVLTKHLRMIHEGSWQLDDCSILSA
jgi:serine/threonine protein kinase